MSRQLTICQIALIFLLVAALLPACRQAPANPPAAGFDLEHSDPAAIELADSVMVAIGGRKNWDDTQFISWSFFGRRNLVWDKNGGRVRIESLPDSTIYLLKLDDLQGRVQVRGVEITEPDSLSKMLAKGKSIWINDSYWLVMPFKLKDSGVTLKYLGEDTTMTGVRCNTLELTFRNVGDTPENKYRVYVDLRDNLVKQWAFYRRANQDSANWVRPWDNYRRHGKILLSSDRSDNAGPADVRVDDRLPDALFAEFRPD